jgi:hypothetical protein
VWSKLLGLNYLFLVSGLILLSAAGLLGPLPRLIRHLVGLSGLIALLRLIRLILLCHNSFSCCISMRFFVRVQRLLTDIRLRRQRPGLPMKLHSQK